MNNTIERYKDDYTKVQRFFIVLAGALLLGFMWRVRGESGWGSSWGLLASGFLFSMFILTVMGNRNKMNLGFLGITCGSFMLTTPAWGPLLHQMCGYISDDYEVSQGVFETVKIGVSPISGVFIMLCLGFGIPVIFGILLGRGYSDKQWKIKDFIILAVCFFAVDYLTKAFVSPFIVKLVQPEAVTAVEQILPSELGYAEKAASVAGKSAYEIYLSHFNDIAWGKKLLFGRNYFTEIDTISSALSGIGALLATRFIIKDKIAARVGTISCIAFSVAITVAGLWFVADNKYETAFDNAHLYAWSLWEYGTGFIAGGILTFFMLRLPKTENVRETAFNFIPEKIRSILSFLIGFVFLLGVNIVRPFTERFEDSGVVCTVIFTAISVIFALILTVYMVKKNGISCEKENGMKNFVSVFLPVVFMLIFITYGFLGSPDKMNFINDYSSLHTVLIVLSAIILSCLYIKKRKAPEMN